MVVSEGGGNADDDRVKVRDVSVIGGGRKTRRFRIGDFVRQDAMDVRSTCRKGIHLLLVDIEASDPELLLTEEESQRQANITKTNDAYAQFA
jgi:hypothetical protein